MAPIDRNERRQQRIRGAGAPTVLANFGFNIGAGAAPLLAPPSTRRTPRSSAKQSSVPPQSSRRTPDSAIRNGSAKRFRSASIQRSGSAQLDTVREFVTPKLGKRKRSHKHASPREEDGEADELSPENEDHTVQSVEKSRRFPPMQSPMQEDDGIPDELSYVDDNSLVSSMLKAAESVAQLTQESPIRRASNASAMNRTPVAEPEVMQKGDAVSRGANMPLFRTPVLPPKAQLASRQSQELPSSASDRAAEDSEDELSPQQHTMAVTPAARAPSRSSPAIEDDGELDEISPVQPTPEASSKKATPKQRGTKAGKTKGPHTVSLEISHPLKAIAPVTPAIVKSSRTRTRALEEDPEQVNEVEQDELSPEVSQPERRPSQPPARRPVVAEETEMDELSPEGPHKTKMPTANLNDTEVESDYGDTAEADDATELTPRPAPLPKSARLEKQKQPRKQKPADEPPKKKQKRSGPSEVITTMRLKGKEFAVKGGITVVDAARTLIEKTLNRELLRLDERKRNAQDRDRKRKAGRNLNQVIAFGHEVEDKFLDLQGAKTSLAALSQKHKGLKRDNQILRAEYRAIQNQRDEIALEVDDMIYEQQRDKQAFNDQKDLNSSLFDIEDAVQAGKNLARKEGKENEGPEIPLRMLLDDVSRDVGSGGTFKNLRNFNGVLERAATFLEGRAP
ncbi:hypothetical protein EJ04DRAFT_580594 [Polyplosphaeria fusca]|uniref:Inner kinetochore subunit AME1 domain-containing protein n=1 Tax=Polyplosphaeria fusca TaxID=682080 RepID=A0A9P4UY30_9PLEO|nr:hypothetical protein EJ04DRAFT_580594 [Polyplosphaeria fusca]